MRVGSAEICAVDLAKCIKARGAHKRVRTPNCTHINMDRVYGRDQYCYVCGREPSLGFLYICKQDDHYPPEGPRQQHGAGNPEESSSESGLRAELEEIGLSPSVIRAAERGEYTPAQLQKLKVLKVEMKQAISDTLQASQIHALAEQLSNIDGASNSVPVATATSNPTPPACEFRACHTCRPYYRDRLYTSFEVVMNGNTSRLTHDDVEDPSCASILTFRTTQSDVDELSKMRRPHRRFYSLGFKGSGDIARDLARLDPMSWRHGLKSAIQGIFRPSHWRESSSSGSNITLPLPRTGTKRDLAEGITNDFDLRTLRRVRKQKERADLRNGVISKGFEQSRNRSGSRGEVDSEGSEESIGNFTVYSCASEGSEVEVDGGVALTEEAVETHIPDILQIREESIPVINGVDSIMTQA
ncbi:hypothetical protein P154DRAFT_546008 [Amniculicola lignicola CBS 123094]|uniref:Uncharacterized protein n=1 Tax=Amniculicola lignicola CBS 123094 TaxID=1392246 RepID=A0A6A5WID2_9PLEO|nr:hypothetical protein P154DRAFT_546008 [Amniculicola lignicola CBS 123094]